MPSTRERVLSIKERIQSAGDLEAGIEELREVLNSERAELAKAQVA